MARFDIQEAGRARRAPVDDDREGNLFDGRDRVRPPRLEAGVDHVTEDLGRLLHRLAEVVAVRVAERLDPDEPAHERRRRSEVVHALSATRTQLCLRATNG